MPDNPTDPLQALKNIGVLDNVAYRTNEEVDLLARLLHVDPSERCSALQVLIL